MPLRLHVGSSSGTTAFEVEDEYYVRLDADGRWSAFEERGARFRRAVDSSVLCPRGDGYRTLPEEDADRIHRRVGQRVGDLRLRLRADRKDAAGGHRRLTRAQAACLVRAAAWSAERLRGEGERFRVAYPESPPILPPHRYRDLVVLPATGCPNHRCTFCAFYRDRPFRPLDDEAFERHVESVLTLFGRMARERSGWFLGSASALSLTDALLDRRLRAVTQRLPLPRRGVAAFLDPEHAPRRCASDWQQLAARGVTDVTMGLETADPDLRRRWGKQPDLARFTQAVTAAAASPVALALTVLVGVGSEPTEHRHRERTVAYLATLPLRATDRVYLAPLPAPGARGEAESSWRRELSRRLAVRIGGYRIERYAWLA